MTFLLGVEEQIHELVRATIGGERRRAARAAFGEAGVLVSYTSEGRLCSVLEGLVLGTAEHYGEAVIVEEIQCMHRGDAGCVFTVRAQLNLFARAARAPVPLRKQQRPVSTPSSRGFPGGNSRRRLRSGDPGHLRGNP